MKALILATDIYTRGGIARYTYTFASALAELLGPENVHVLALLGGGDPSDLHPRFRLLGPVTDRLTAGAKVQFTMKALALARKKYDLVIANHVALGQVAGVIRLLWGTPFWVACYGHEVWRRIPMLKLAALRGAELAFAISQFTREKLQKVNGIPAGKIRLLYNAVPTQLASLLLSPDGKASAAAPGGGERVLLSVGDLSKAHAYKGFDTVIRALPKILALAPNARYVIVGEGDNRSNLEKMAAEVAVGDRVTFAGGLPDSGLAALYRTCEVFVMPSRALGADGLASGEGLGFVYLEAALAGKPVVGSREGGAAEAVLHGRTGLLVDPRSVDEVADAVVALLSDAEQAAGMGAAGRRWALENFTLPAMSRALEELLRLTGHSLPVSRCVGGAEEPQRHGGTEKSESRN
jgi:glycosyltransferase involved in cell wall biosynthesis